MTPPPLDNWLNAKAAALYLGYSARHLRRLVDEGSLVAYRLGGKGRPRFRQSDLDQAVRRLDAQSAPRTDSCLAEFINHHTKRG